MKITTILSTAAISAVVLYFHTRSEGVQDTLAASIKNQDMLRGVVLGGEDISKVSTDDLLHGFRKALDIRDNVTTKLDEARPLSAADDEVTVDDFVITALRVSEKATSQVVLKSIVDEMHLRIAA